MKKLKLKTTMGKYIKVPFEIIENIEINRLVCNFQPFILKAVRNDEPMQCKVKLRDGGILDLIIINGFEPVSQYELYMQSLKEKK